MSLSTLSLQQISKKIGSTYFNRGMRYYRSRKVINMNTLLANDSRIELKGDVVGSYQKSYSQSISIFKKSGEKIGLEGFCSCPVSYNCKHVAAVVISYLKEQANSPQSRQQPNQLAPELSVWLSKVEQASQIRTSINETKTGNLILDLLQSIEQDSILIYLIDESWRYSKYDLSVEIRAAKLHKRGGTLNKGTIISPQSVHTTSHYFCDHADIEIAQLCVNLYEWNHTPIHGRAGSILIDLLLQTGRCFWKSPSLQPLQKGPIQPFVLKWREIKKEVYSFQKNRSITSSNYKLEAKVPEGEILNGVYPLAYIDIKNNQLGWAENELCPSELLSKLLNSPSVSEDDRNTISIQLMEVLPPGILEDDYSAKIEEFKDILPVPLVTLNKNTWGKEYISLEFQYGDVNVFPVPVKSTQLISVGHEKWARLHRDNDKEIEVTKTLHNLGFIEVPSTTEYSLLRLAPLDQGNSDFLGIQEVQIWDNFLQAIPELQKQGWIINQSDNFSLQIHDSDIEGFIDEDSDDNDWFSLKFDLDINGSKVPLIPMVLPLLKQDTETLPETVVVPYKEDEYARISSDILKPFLKILIELYNREVPLNGESISFSPYDAGLVKQIDDSRIPLFGGDHIKRLADQLSSFQVMESVQPHDNLQATLRPYQEQGLSWLQFLREYNLRGILADDMGLGKTIQALAHLQLEKQHGRLNDPALIVAPTSLMGNWRREAELFTPDLKVTTLQGSDRFDYFDHIEESDIVLTTYPLLSRDSDILMSHHYHYLILDEAQAIKNHKTKAAKLIRRLNFDHAFCLTGTPMENHLGELWSMFDFLMPGFLGTEKLFKKIYRNPIEKDQDPDQKANLSKRVRPFLLRRTKDEVATELPRKTEITKMIPLGKKQAAIYENIRISMDKRIRETIANKGLARSHITILDALLKLRQVCCDPKLLNMSNIKAEESAKLELLLQMLPELLAEGRKILLFSQFTSMLAIIEKELNQQKINYTKLTGSTKKRDEVIETFTSGEVDLFLVSLKAGGVGLNLTQADTVILYDPWWNPAVEDQAIDRAHRIGQDKPVFIYKLVVENSVEEKMLAMQERKRNLAKGIYSSTTDQGAALIDQDSLNMLFQPLGDS